MSQPRIDKQFPIPVKYPFAGMQVGDSFAVPKGVGRTAVSISALRYSRKHGGKFTVRLMPDRSLRCWRLE